VGGVIPVVGTASHPQVLAFAYCGPVPSPGSYCDGGKHVALLNAQVLATGTPGVDDGTLVDFQGDLPLVASSYVSFSGGDAYIAGGIPDNGRKGVWLATADGYVFFDLTTNTLGTAPGTKYPIELGQELAENLGGDITHNLLLGGNYTGVQLIDLLAAKSYAGDTGIFPSPTYPNIDADSVDSGYQVGIFTFEDTNDARFVNLATITKTGGVGGAPNTFTFAADGAAHVIFGSTTFSGSAVDSTSHLALFMAGYSTFMGVGQLQDPNSVPAGGTWQGLSDWSYYNLGSSTALGGYEIATDPHAAGVVFNLGAGKPFGYLLDGCTIYSTHCRAVQIDMAAFLALTRAGAPGSGNPAHELASGTDPAAAGGPVKQILFGP
jgi:hypothetical protein